MDGPIRVLHVDDDPDFADLAATYLEREDDRFEVATATSAGEGIDRVESAAFDCVVSDYEMPGMDGIGFLEAVREEHPDLPFILFTGQGNEAVASEAISAGVTDYLQKGGGTDQYTILANRIENAVESARAQAAVQRLERLSEAFPDLIFYIDEDGRYLDVLAGNATLEQYDLSEEMVGRTLGFKSSPETADRLVGAVQRALDDGEMQTVEYSATVDSEPRWFEARVMPSGTTQSGRRTVVWAARDVTERKERQRTLRQYRALVNSLDDTVCTYDEEGRFELVNERLVEQYGADPEELRGRRSEVLERLCREADGDPYRELLEGERDEIRREIESPPGQEGMVAEYRLTRLEMDGTCQGAVAVSRDITERKRRERELEEAKERLELALEASKLGVFDWNPKTDEIGFDEGVAEMLGLSVDELERDISFWTERTHPDDLAAIQPDVRKLRRGEEEVVSNEYRISRSDGEWIWTQSFGKVFEWDEDGTPSRIIGVHQDVTDRKERERELERTNDRLEEFTRIVSHDLRSPLNVAQGRVELAREDCYSEHLDRADAALDRMGTLIEDLLTLAREGESATSFEPVGVEEAAVGCWNTVETGEARLVVETDRELRADPGRLQQVLANLFGNAVEHGSTSPASQARQDAVEHGGEGVTVRVGDLEDGFYVEDDGPGIPAGERERVFESGYSTAEGGTGFGLSIVERICEAHGWTVEATESGAGGARFEVTGVEFA